MERPDYRLFENNCQNFAKYLLEVVCPGAARPETIQSVLIRLQTINQNISQRLPGTYPSSKLMFAKGCMSTLTESRDEWVTAAETFSKPTGERFSVASNATRQKVTDTLVQEACALAAADGLLRSNSPK